MKHAWLINLLSIAGIVVCLVLVPKEDTVTGPPVVQPKVVLADAMWSNYVEGMAEQCAIDALVAAPKLEDADELFNRCVRIRGLTI